MPELNEMEYLDMVNLTSAISSFAEQLRASSPIAAMGFINIASGLRVLSDNKNQRAMTAIIEGKTTLAKTMSLILKQDYSFSALTPTKTYTAFTITPEKIWLSLVVKISQINHQQQHPAEKLTAEDLLLFNSPYPVSIETLTDNNLLASVSIPQANGLGVVTSLIHLRTMSVMNTIISSEAYDLKEIRSGAMGASFFLKDVVLEEIFTSLMSHEVYSTINVEHVEPSNEAITVDIDGSLAIVGLREDGDPIVIDIKKGVRGDCYYVISLELGALMGMSIGYKNAYVWNNLPKPLQFIIKHSNFEVSNVNTIKLSVNADHTFNCALLD